jgi:hypothetical protein
MRASGLFLTPPSVISNWIYLQRRIKGFELHVVATQPSHGAAASSLLEEIQWHSQVIPPGVSGHPEGFSCLWLLLSGACGVCLRLPTCEPTRRVRGLRRRGSSWEGALVRPRPGHQAISGRQKLERTMRKAALVPLHSRGRARADVAAGELQASAAGLRCPPRLHLAALRS